MKVATYLGRVSCNVSNPHSAGLQSPSILVPSSAYQLVPSLQYLVVKLHACKNNSLYQMLCLIWLFHMDIAHSIVRKISLAAK